MRQPYTVVVDKPGCKHCGAGKSWMVRRPDGICGSTSYESLDDAEHEADILNDAFHAGAEYAMAALEKIRTNKRSERVLPEKSTE